MNKKLSVIAVAALIAASNFTPSFAYTYPKLNDAKTNIEKISELKRVNIVNGYENGSLGLENTLKRSELTKLVVYGLGQESKAVDLQAKEKPFSDVEEDYWANGVINVAKTLKTNNGITLINGYPDGTFLPENEITYAELITILVKIKKDDLTNEMIKNANWPSDYYKWAIEEKIIGEGTGIKESDVLANEKAIRKIAFEGLYNTTVKDVTKQENKKSEISGLRINNIILSDMDSREKDDNSDSKKPVNPINPPVKKPDESKPAPIPEKPTKPSVNKTELSEKIKEAKEQDLDFKTEKSISELKKAIEEAQKILDSETATQEEVNSSVQKLKDAIENLEEDIDPNDKDITLKLSRSTVVKTAKLKVLVSDDSSDKVFDYIRKNTGLVIKIDGVEVSKDDIEMKASDKAILISSGYYNEDGTHKITFEKDGYVNKKLEFKVSKVVEIDAHSSATAVEKLGKEFKQKYMPGEKTDYSALALDLKFENSDIVKEVTFKQFEQWGITIDPQDYTTLPSVPELFLQQ